MGPRNEVNVPHLNNLLNEVITRSRQVSRRRIQYNNLYTKMNTKHKTLNERRDKLKKGDVMIRSR